MSGYFFIKCQNNGRILQTCFTSEDIKILNENEYYIDLETYQKINSNPSLFYFENNTLFSKPDKPNGEYTFNYDIKQWEFDRAAAETKALDKRNQLLAEGPDRISPMWWSSMEQEEQQSWTDYRQALLDITSQPNYPQEIVWPTKP